MRQQQQFDTSFSQDRLIARLSNFPELLVVVLVATGVYGAFAYAVNRRPPKWFANGARRTARTGVMDDLARKPLRLPCRICAGIAIGDCLLATASIDVVRSDTRRLSDVCPSAVRHNHRGAACQLPTSASRGFHQSNCRRAIRMSSYANWRGYAHARN